MVFIDIKIWVQMYLFMFQIILPHFFMYNPIKHVIFIKTNILYIYIHTHFVWVIDFVCLHRRHANVNTLIFSFLKIIYQNLSSYWGIIQNRFYISKIFSNLHLKFILLTSSVNLLWHQTFFLYKLFLNIFLV